MAGMRAYEQQQRLQRGGAGTNSSSSGTVLPPLPPVLSEFIAWAGDFLAGEDARGVRTVEARARGYVDGSGHLGGGQEPGSTPDEEDWCCICLNALSDESVYGELGEPVRTVGCGHRFHAVCFARHLEASEQDPWCPMCRGGDLA